MADRNKKVIGYFAFASPTEVVCTSEPPYGCLIVGSVGAMKSFLTELDPDGVRRHTIKKTRFGEVLSGLKMGAAYAFDERAYKTFFPLARAVGIPVEEANFSEMEKKGFRFFTVQLETL